MNAFSDSTQTPWIEDVRFPQSPALKENLHCDVCVIGAGIAGLTTAYLLSKKGQKVCVLDALNIGEGQTGLTTAHITVALDTRYSELINTLGVEKACQVLESHLEAMKEIEEIIAIESIDCDLKSVNGYLCASLEDKEIEVIKNEFFALHRVGLQGILRMQQAPLPQFTEGPCLVFPQQMQFHPLKYLKGLCECIQQSGGVIYSQTHVKEVQGTYVVTDAGYSVSAKSVVVATNTPINDLVTIHTKQFPYRTYALAYKVPKNTVHRGLFWDLKDPYHYLRTQNFSERDDIFIVGGEDHKTGQHKNPQECFENLDFWSRQKFSFLQEKMYQWSGQVMETMDGLPFLGHNPLDNKNVYVITGHSGVGMTESTLGAMIVADQIMGLKNHWSEIYSPSRFSLRSLPEYLKENMNVATQYAHWLLSQSLKSIDDLKIGEGTIVNDGLKKVALYRKSDSDIKSFSASCPHLKGVVQWNNVEKTWDCPCHGSRFSSEGEVIEGPSSKGLEAYPLSRALRKVG